MDQRRGEIAAHPLAERELAGKDAQQWVEVEHRGKPAEGGVELIIGDLVNVPG